MVPILKDANLRTILYLDLIRRVELKYYQYTVDLEVAFFVRIKLLLVDFGKLGTLSLSLLAALDMSSSASSSDVLKYLSLYSC